MLERIDALLEVVGNETPVTDRDFIELDLISDLVVEYEEIHYPVEPPTLTEMIRLRMAEMGLSQKGLAQLLGVSPPRISEYMTGKSEPALKVARLLLRNWILMQRSCLVNMLFPAMRLFTR